MTGRLIWGLLFITFGVLAFIDQAGWLPGGSWNYIWPLALIAIGAGVLLRTSRRSDGRLDHPDRIERDSPSSLTAGNTLGGGI